MYYRFGLLFYLEGGAYMLKLKLQIITLLITSFSSWIYCIAVVVLGLIYQAFPGQEQTAVLISTLPMVVMMVAAFASSVILQVFNKKLIVILSIAIAIISGLLIVAVDMPLIGVLICSALLGIPGGVIPAANPVALTVISPSEILDRALGWYNAFKMLGMAVFTLLGGVFANTGRFQDGYKTVLLLIPVLLLTILFYPDIDKMAGQKVSEKEPATSDVSPTVKREKFPSVAVGLLLVYLVGAIFWNTWYLNYSDYIVNEAQIGTTALAGVIGSLCSVAGTISGFLSDIWIKITKKYSVTLAFILCGLFLVVPPLTRSVIGCYVGGIVNMFFNLMIVAVITIYLGRTTHGKATTTAMSLLSGIEGSGVFLCSYIVPSVGKIFGGGAGTNMLLSGVLLIVIGLAAYFVIKPAHKIAYQEEGSLIAISLPKQSCHRKVKQQELKI